MNTMRKSYCFSVNVIRERYLPLEGVGGGQIENSNSKVIIKINISIRV
jgi:hypothetical protein